MSLREGPFGDLKVSLTWMGAVALAVAIVVAVAVLLSDRRETLQTEAYDTARRTMDVVAAPVGGVLSAPVRWTGNGVDFVSGYFFAVSENRRLKAELAEMRQWRDVALSLKDVNDRYQALLKLNIEPPIDSVAARTILDARGPFANTRLADAGREKGVAEGMPAISEHGLIGRVTGVTNGASRILLLTDVASRVPVMVDRTNARAILTGDGGSTPTLSYLRGRDPIRKGDRIVSSGDGGLIPRGIPVGVAAPGADGRWHVVLDADSSSIDFVRILKFRSFDELVKLEELNRLSAPPADKSLTTPPPPKPGAASAKPSAPAVAKPAAPAPSTSAPPTSAATKPAVPPTAAAKPPAARPTAPKPAEPSATP